MGSKKVKRKKPESEKDVEEYLISRMKEVRGHAYKWVSPGRRGVPDRICFFPSLVKGGLGKIFFVEVKSEDVPVRADQARELDRLQDNYGQMVVVVDTKQKVDAIVDSYIEAKNELQKQIISIKDNTFAKPKSGIIIPGRE